MGVKFKAVFGVEAFRLHDIPYQRIEYRQREAGDLDDRLLLGLRRHGWRSGDRKRESERGKAASRQIDHGLFPLVAVQTVILLVTWHERERDFTLVSFACK